MRVIPAIDLRHGRCVRLFKGEYDQETVYSNDPVDVARQFEALGFRDLHIVDLDGAKDGRQQNTQVVREISSATSLSIQLGGGIRDAGTFRQWLANGVDRCVIGSKAIEEPVAARSWLDEFGPDRTVLALDVRIRNDGVPRLAAHGWTVDTEQSLWDCVSSYQRCGARHVLCTDINRDGAMSGPNLDLYREFVERFPDVALQASGGVRSATDLHSLVDIGVHSAITGRALLDGRIGKEEIRSFLPAA